MVDAPFPLLPRPLLFGHRGASAQAPENTRQAFDLAIRSGVDVLEMDVHLSRDGVVVVHHDATVDRTTNGTGKVRTLSCHELEALDAGYRFENAAGELEFRGRGCRIPRLAEVLEAFPNTALNIEVKQRHPSMVRAVLAELEHAGSDQVVLAAADDVIMAELEAARPGIPLGLSVAQCWRFWWRAMLGRAPTDYRGRSFQVPPYQYGVLPVTTERVLAAAHAVGIEVHVWTINSAAEARHWLARGVDGIMSDDPARVVDAVRAARSGNS